MATVALTFRNPEKKTSAEIADFIADNPYLTIQHWEINVKTGTIEIVPLGDAEDLYASNQEDTLFDFVLYMNDKLKII